MAWPNPPKKRRMNLNPLDLGLLALALWRVSSLLVSERGPFDAFLRLRSWAGIAHDDGGAALSFDGRGYFAGLLFCVWCTSLVLAFGVAALYVVAPAVARVAALPFALSALAIAFNRGVGK